MYNDFERNVANSSVTSPSPRTCASPSRRWACWVAAWLVAGGCTEPTDNTITQTTGETTPGGTDSGGGGSDSTPSKDASGGPKACSSDDECAGGLCLPYAKVCVDCAANDDCAAPTDRCVHGVCEPHTACQTDKICVESGQVCDTAEGICVDCGSDSDCPEGQSCKAHVCLAPVEVACTSSKECASLERVCDKDAGLCTECVVDDDCFTGWCDAGSCAPRACTPGKASCSADGKLQTCDARGTGRTLSACAKGQACVDGACKTAACDPSIGFFCDGDFVKHCAKEAQSADTVQDCAKSGKTCLAGECVAASCTPGTASCASPTELATCNAAGNGYDKTLCGNSQVCLGGACKAQVCEPAAVYCDGTTVMSCDKAGSAATVVSNCAGSGKVCKAGACVQPDCQAGEKSCKNGAVTTCKGDGSGFETTSCDDGDACTDDGCAAGACTHAAKACDDGDVCTSDGCAAGACAHAAIPGCCTSPAQCDDGNACTVDGCNAANACTHSAAPGCCKTAGDCDDGDACTQDTCGTDGNCSHSAVAACCNNAVQCDDGNACTVDLCAATHVCTHSPAPDCCAKATDCNDGDACTQDSCIGGKCSHGAIASCCNNAAQCNDNDPCTTDSCNNQHACQHAPSNGPGCCEPLVWKADFEDGSTKGTPPSPFGYIFNKPNSTTNGWQLWLGGPYAHTGKGMLYYGNIAKQNYDFGASSGVYNLLISLPVAKKVTLSFWIAADIEATKDYDILQVRVEATTVWNKLMGGFTFGGWNYVEVDITQWAGANPQIYFDFDTVDAKTNTGFGIRLDDITITRSCN